MADMTESLEREATSGETSSNTVRTFLNTLKAPRLSELTILQCVQRGIEPEKNIIVSHVSSCKHKTGKEKLGTKEARERDIAKLLQENDKVIHPVGETLPMEQRVYRVS